MQKMKPKVKHPQVEKTFAMSLPYFDAGKPQPVPSFPAFLFRRSVL